MSTIEINKETCIRCGQCTIVCPNHLFERSTSDDYPSCIENAEDLCIGCNHCVAACPSGALSVDDVKLEDCSLFEPAVMRFEQVAQLIRKRRSIRHYSTKPLDNRIIEQLLDVVRWAPTAKNSLPIKWVIVNNADKVRELASIILDVAKKQSTTGRSIDAWLKEWEKGGDPIFRGAPCVVGAYTDDQTSHWSEIDSAIAVESLDLCASAMRLGACWAGIFVRAAQSPDKMILNDWLGLKETETIHAGLMLGHIGDESYRRIPWRPESHKIWIR